MVHKVVYHSGVLSRMQLVLLQFSTEVTHSEASILCVMLMYLLHVFDCFCCVLLLQILLAVCQLFWYICIQCQNGQHSSLKVWSHLLCIMCNV